MKTIYICKILTPEFKIKFDAEIKREVALIIEKKITEGKLVEGKTSWAEKWNELTCKDSYYSMWNNQEAESYHIEYTTITENGKKEIWTVKSLYEDLGLWTPEFTEAEFEAQETGLQSQPRILWNNEILKIDEIEEIISFKTKK